MAQHDRQRPVRARKLTTTTTVHCEHSLPKTLLCAGLQWHCKSFVLKLVGQRPDVVHFLYISYNRSTTNRSQWNLGVERNGRRLQVQWRESTDGDLASTRKRTHGRTHEGSANMADLLPARLLYAVVSRYWPMFSNRLIGWNVTCLINYTNSSKYNIHFILKQIVDVSATAAAAFVGTTVRQMPLRHYWPMYLSVTWRRPAHRPTSQTQRRRRRRRRGRN